MTKYKILMHGHIMVNGAMLSKGIYEVNIPVLHSQETTIESLKNKARHAFLAVFHTNIGDDYMERYIYNLEKCHLVEFELVPAKPELTPAPN